MLGTYGGRTRWANCFILASSCPFLATSHLGTCQAVGCPIGRRKTLPALMKSEYGREGDLSCMKQELCSPVSLSTMLGCHVAWPSAASGAIVGRENSRRRLERN